MSIFSKAEEKEIKISDVKKTDCKVNFKIEAGSSLVNRCFQDATVAVQSRAQMHGFRAGKVPLVLVKQNFGSHIKERAVDYIIKSAVSKSIEMEKLNPVSVPTLTMADFSSLEEGKPFKFEFDVEVAPEVEPKDYTGIKVTKKSETATAEEVEMQIKAVLESNSRLEEDKDASVKEDSFVVVKYTGSKNGKEDPKYTAESELVDMSAPQTITGLTDAVKGLKKGESKEFETKAGEDTVTMNVTVEEIKKKVAPALDDTFAKDLGFDTVELLKAKIKENMDAEKKADSERDVVKQIEDALVAKNNFCVPQGLVQEQTEAAVNNFLARFGGPKAMEIPPAQRKELGDKMRPNVEKDIRIGYLVHAIAKKESLTATEEDWKAEMEKTLAENPKKDEARIKEFFEERKQHILATLNERKVFDFLKAKAEMK